MDREAVVVFCCLFLLRLSVTILEICSSVYEVLIDIGRPLLRAFFLRNQVFLSSLKLKVDSRRSPSIITAIHESIISIFNREMRDVKLNIHISMKI